MHTTTGENSFTSNQLPGPWYKNTIVLVSLSFIFILLVGVIVVTLSSAVNSQPLPAQQTASSISLSSKSQQNSSTTTIAVTSGKLKQPILGSNEYSTESINFSLAVGGNWSQIFQDASGIAFTNSNNYLYFQVEAENSPALYEKKLDSEVVDTQNLGLLHRIVLDTAGVTEYASQRFGVSGNYWYGYSNSYKETDCGNLFDINTGKSNPAPACGSTLIVISNASKSIPLSVVCAVSQEQDRNKCDTLLNTLKLAIE